MIGAIEWEILSGLIIWGGCLFVFLQVFRD
jgi:hypothetical protein